MHTMDDRLGRIYITIDGHQRFKVVGYDPSTRRVRVWHEAGHRNEWIPASLFFASLHTGAIEEAL